MPSSTPPPAERILIIRPSALGDVVRTMPVLVSLRDAYPKARIDWLVQDSFADAIRLHPALTNAIPFPRKEFGRFGAWLPAGAAWKFLASLKAPKYDLVLDCQGLFRSGLFAWSTRAPLRVGYRDARELGWLGVQKRVEVREEQHTVERMLALVESLGIKARRDAVAQRLEAGHPARAWAAQRLGLKELGSGDAHGPGGVGGGGWSGRKYAVLAPTSRWPGKQWPAERFAEVARHLVDKGVLVVVVGSGGERGQVEPVLELAKRTPLVLDLLGQTSIAQLMAVIERSALVVANDSAALHMGVAFARPLVALFGPTRVNRVGPYGRDADVIQHVTAKDELDHKDDKAGRRLMERITAAEVIAAVDQRVRLA